MQKIITIVIVLMLALLAGCSNQQQQKIAPTIPAPVSAPSAPAKVIEVAEPAAPQAEAAPAEKTETPSAGTTKEFTMTAKNWAFDPLTIEVNKGDHVVLTITSGDITHGFALPDFDVNVQLEPGKTVKVEFDADTTGTFDFFCSVSCGHDDQGHGHRTMRGKLVVKE